MGHKTEIIYGSHAVRHAIESSPALVLELWIQEGRTSGGHLETIAALAAGAGITIQHATRTALDKLCDGGSHQGVVVRRRVRNATGSDLVSFLEALDNTVPLILVLDGIQDPHNLGACLRTANAAGTSAVIIPGDRAVGVNATVRKVACGAVEHTPVITVTNLSRALTQLRDRGVWCFGLSETAPTNLHAADLTVPLALVLGAEGKGLRQNTRHHCDRLLAIPMYGQVESLNVSAAAAVCLFEAARQRENKAKGV